MINTRAPDGANKGTFALSKKTNKILNYNNVKFVVVDIFGFKKQTGSSGNHLLVTLGGVPPACGRVLHSSKYTLPPTQIHYVADTNTILDTRCYTNTNV